MGLFTHQQFERLLDHGRLGNHGKDWYPVAKLILPGTGCAWLISEIVNRNNQLYGYGISDFGCGMIQDGLIDIGVLEVMRDPLQTHHVQRAEDFIPLHRMSVYQTAARMHGAITDDADALQEALEFLATMEAQSNPQYPRAPQLQP